MAFKRLAAIAVLLLLLVTTAAQAAGGDGQELAVTVPRPLTATNDRDARCVECTLGDTVADAVRKYLGADIAIVCGGDLRANLYGDITWDELRSAFTEDRTLATAKITVRQLHEILEAGVSRVQLSASERIDMTSVYDGFPQISGFTFSYDASAPAGQRVLHIYFNDEELKLDDDTKTFTLAATAFMLEGGYGLPGVEDAVSSDLTLSEVTARFLNDGTDDSLQTGERIHTMGTPGGSLSIPLIAMIVIACIFLTIFRRIGKTQHTRYFRYYPR